MYTNIHQRLFHLQAHLPVREDGRIVAFKQPVDERRDAEAVERGGVVARVAAKDAVVGEAVGAVADLLCVW